MNSITNALTILAVSLAAPLAAQEVFDTPSPFDEGVTTGIGVGETIPDFRLPDSSGELRDFDSIKGPNGAVLLFYRSADW